MGGFESQLYFSTTTQYLEVENSSNPGEGAGGRYYFRMGRDKVMVSLFSVSWGANGQVLVE